MNLENLRLRNKIALVGFDGFVDSIGRMVGRRVAGGEVEPVGTIEEFGELIRGAAGRNFGREIVIQRVEGGGNAPNLADGLMALGMEVNLWGTIGDPRHPAFDALAGRCRSLAPIGQGYGRTLALEFDDGKLMLNDTGDLGGVDAALIAKAIDNGYGEQASQADLLGLANWSRYPRMTECWRLVAERVGPMLRSGVWIVVDLADPSGRDEGEVREALGVLRELQRHGRVVLGLNLNEAGIVAQAIGVTGPIDEDALMLRTARSIHEKLGVEMVVIHSQSRAGGAWTGGEAVVPGAFTASPRRTTGVGDRFNSGLAAGLVGGMSPEESLALGCAAGGFFVRERRAGTPGELAAMCREWAGGEWDDN